MDRSLTQPAPPSVDGAGLHHRRVHAVEGLAPLKGAKQLLRRQLHQVAVTGEMELVARIGISIDDAFVDETDADHGLDSSRCLLQRTVGLMSLESPALLRVAGPGHAIADPANGEDIGGTARVVAELVAEPLHIGSNQSRVSSLPPPPYLTQ